MTWFTKEGDRPNRSLSHGTRGKNAISRIQTRDGVKKYTLSTLFNTMNVLKRTEKQTVWFATYMAGRLNVASRQEIVLQSTDCCLPRGLIHHAHGAASRNVGKMSGIGYHIVSEPGRDCGSSTSKANRGAESGYPSASHRGRNCNSCTSRTNRSAGSGYPGASGNGRNRTRERQVGPA